MGYSKLPQTKKDELTESGSDIGMTRKGVERKPSTFWYHLSTYGRSPSTFINHFGYVGNLTFWYHLLFYTM